MLVVLLSFQLQLLLQYEVFGFLLFDILFEEVSLVLLDILRSDVPEPDPWSVLSLE